MTITPEAWDELARTETQREGALAYYVALPLERNPWNEREAPNPYDWWRQGWLEASRANGADPYGITLSEIDAHANLWYRRPTPEPAGGGGGPSRGVVIASGMPPDYLPEFPRSEKVAEPAPFSLEVRTAREVCALPEPDVSDELCGPILRRRARTIVAAATGEGKTTLTAHLVSAVVEQRDFLGWTGAGGRALILDLEQDVSDAKRVLREAGLADSDAVDYVLVPDGLALDRRDEERAAVELVLARGYAVVVIDPHYKAQDGGSETPDNSPLMRLLDRWRAKYGFALILPMHLRKPPPGVKTRPTIDDIAGFGARVRGAEIILLLELANEGYSRLTFGKIRGIGPHRETWGLLYDREHGYRRDPSDNAPPRDLEAEIDTYLAEHPRSTTNAIAKGIGAGKGAVSTILKGSARFTFEAGPNRSRLWVTQSDENHTGHLFHPSGGQVTPVVVVEPPEVTTTHGGSEEPDH